MQKPRRVETETRAVITTAIRNATQVPVGVVMDERTKKMRASGERYRYVLERVDGPWLAAEIWQWQGDMLWWRRYLPHDLEPSADTHTHNGI